MKMKYHLNNTTIWLIVIIVILLISAAAKADDSIYIKSGNQVIKAESFILMLSENVTSDILIDNSSIYFYTINYVYIVNSTSGERKHKIKIEDKILEQKLTDHYLFVRSSTVLYKINTDSGAIEGKRGYNRYLDAIYSLFGNGVMSNTDDYNFIAGDNINIIRSGNNVTITGAATWTLSGITTDEMYGMNNSCKYGQMCAPEGTIKYLNLIADYLYVHSPLAEFSGNVWVGGKNITNISDRASTIETNVSILQDNISELPKFRQMAFEINMNTTVLKNELVLIPYDFFINNVTTQLDNDSGFFNYSIVKYSSYPSGKSTIQNINATAYLTITDMNTTVLNRHESIEIQYHNYSKINNTIILFELELR